MKLKLKFCTVLFTAVTLIAPLSVEAEQAQNLAAAKSFAVEKYGSVPLSFEPTESAARFLARSGSYAVSIGARQSWVAVTDAKSGKRHQALGFAFDHANPAAGLEPLDVQPGVTNYYLGADAAKWRLGVKSYAKLRTQDLYPGVDVVYYGDHRHLEFDFVVAPKADPDAIALKFSGMDTIYKDGNGDLVAELNGRPVRFAKPYAYQRVAGVIRVVPVDYELAASGSVHLRLGDYDPSLELTIDPAITYATYLGGSLGDVGNGIAVDSLGAAYVTGQTCSSDFPDAANNSGYVYTANCDAFVTKYRADGTTVEYTTILGGTTPPNSSATGTAIALDSSKQAYVAGWTNFSDLPGVLNSYQGGDSDAFVTILTATGTLLRATYLGGSKADNAFGIAVDNASNVIVVGQTDSSNFPQYNAFETMVEEWVAFVTKLDNGLHIASPVSATASAIAPPPTAAPGTTYYFSETFGGQTAPPAPTAVWAAATYFYPGTIIEDNTTPIPNIQITWKGGTTGASEPIWSPAVLAYTTGDGSVVWQNLGPVTKFYSYASEAYGVALDPAGDVFVAGGTNTPNLYSSIWPFMYITFQGTGAWVLKVSGVNGAFIYGTPLEDKVTDLTGTIDTANAIAVDSQGSAYVVGTTTGSLFNTATAYQTTLKGTQNAFLTKLNNLGSAFVYSTYLGGTGLDRGLGVAVDKSFSAYLTGATKSSDFPIINPLTNPNNSLPLNYLDGAQDAFLTKFTSDGTSLILSAYLGGSGIDQGNAIAIVADPTDQKYVDMYVAGTTTSTDLETTLLQQATTTVPIPPYTPPQTSYGGGASDAFVAMLLGASVPTVTVTPSSLSFSSQDLNTQSAPQAVQYINTSTSSTVDISNIVFTSSSGDFSQDFKGGIPGDCYSGSIKPSTACNIWVVFTPTASGQVSGTLTITDNVSLTPYSIQLFGNGAAPIDVLTPSSLAFSSQAVNTTSTAQTVTLKNETTNSTLSIGSIATTGDFSETNTCGVQVAAGVSCTISVYFTPTTAGALTGSLIVTDNSLLGGNSVSLSGAGATVTSGSGVISLNPASLAFGTTSSSQTVILTNSSTTSVLSSPSIVITGSSDFTQTNNCPTSLAVGGTCSIVVTFAPTAPGTETATLTVSGGAANSPQSITMTGGGGEFKMTPITSGIAVTEGSTATYALSLTPLNGFTGSIKFTCSGLPANAGCSFSPNPVTMDGTTVKTVTLSVGTKNGSASSSRPRLLPRSIFLALLPFSVMGILLINKRRSVWLVAGLVFLCLLLGLAGCGSAGSSNSTTGDVSTGTYTFTVTATSSANASQTQSFVLTLVVAPQ